MREKGANPLTEKAAEKMALRLNCNNSIERFLKALSDEQLIRFVEQSPNELLDRWLVKLIRIRDLVKGRAS